MQHKSTSTTVIFPSPYECVLSGMNDVAELAALKADQVFPRAFSWRARKTGPLVLVVVREKERFQPLEPPGGVYGQTCVLEELLGKPAATRTERDTLQVVAFFVLVKFSVHFLLHAPEDKGVQNAGEIRDHQPKVDRSEDRVGNRAYQKVIHDEAKNVRSRFHDEKGRRESSVVVLKLRPRPGHLLISLCLVARANGKHVLDLVQHIVGAAREHHAVVDCDHKEELGKHFMKEFAHDVGGRYRKAANGKSRRVEGRVAETHNDYPRVAEGSADFFPNLVQVEEAQSVAGRLVEHMRQLH